VAEVVEHNFCESVLVLLKIWLVLTSCLGLEMGTLTDISWCFSVRPGKHRNSGRPIHYSTSNPSISAIWETWRQRGSLRLPVKKL